MTIRPATIADVPRMMEIERQAATAAHWTEQNYIDAITKAEPPRVVLVAEVVADNLPAEEGSGVVAFSVAHGVDSEWEIENVAVNVAHRRRGIGVQIVRATFQQIQMAGGMRVRLEVRESNEAARKLYEGLGFRQSGRRRRYYRDPDEDAMLYEIIFGRKADENS